VGLWLRWNLWISQTEGPRPMAFSPRHGYFLTPDFCRQYWIPFFADGTIVRGATSPEEPSFWLNTLSVIRLKYLLVAMLILLAGILSVGPEVPGYGWILPKPTLKLREHHLRNGGADNYDWVSEPPKQLSQAISSDTEFKFPRLNGAAAGGPVLNNQRYDGTVKSECSGAEPVVWELPKRTRSTRQ
jgi:hypothetical protein